ncbi:GGDEF domain-containing protein [Desulfobacula sp.]|uniref:GGDEF domain-containing protein n=1 Tax=Desulfobacula sp. TaxID=2593537 RepID=UPI0026124186|nr:GGDEF domain-containing protein [Desulfobacula sp.]
MINKSYPESIEESGGYLRIALKKIAQYNLPYNPISYLLWYEYATGRNENLIKDLEVFLNAKEVITIEVVTRLFKKHMADSQILMAEKKTKDFKKILLEMTKHLSESCNEIGSQGSLLDTFAQELVTSESLEDISVIANRIVLETKAVVESSKNLKTQLDSTVSEIDTLSKELEGIKQVAKTDMLTGLLNRRGFDGALYPVMEDIKTTHEALSVIMLDIDHFKRVNDTYGHLIGDNVLKMIGKLIKDSIKGKDIAARFGGEEFILTLPQTPLKGAYALAEQIRLNLQKMNLKIKDTGESIGQITISLGVALYKEGESIEAVIQRADNALYHAKNTGRNKTVTEAMLG